jgi:hypothetical protein
MAAVDWRRALVLTHRWLGIAGGLLFVAWFASGIVMMYRRMPELHPAERMARLPPLDATDVRVSPAEAALAAEAPPQTVAGVRLGMHGERPVYRFGTSGTVFADTGELLEPLTTEAAVAVAASFAPEHAATPRHDGRLLEPDQWTLQSRAFLPLHRVALGDPEDTRLYVSERTGEVVMETLRSERAWAYAGAVLHWLYFTPFRTHSTLWAQTIIWVSVAGCLLSLSGIVWGLVRFSWRPRHRAMADASGEHSSPQRASRSPYSGLVRWHHYAGLVFGLVTFTWILSGGLSMDPWSWHPGTAPTRAQREGASGGALRAEELTAERVREGAAALGAGRLAAASPTDASSAIKEVGLVQFRGEPYFVAYRPEATREPPGGTATAASTATAADAPGLVSALAPEARPFARFSDEDVLAAARAAMPGVAVGDAIWLEEYDAYYYGRSYVAGSGLTLPVLRVRYADPQKTWLYLDPVRGTIVRKEERLTRLNRWLYRGLHSLDFPFLYTSRPLWDVLVIVLSLGGLALSATTLAPGWQRVWRSVRRGAPRG